MKVLRGIAGLAVILTILGVCGPDAPEARAQAAGTVVGWSGYAPATAWTTYQPTASWRGYAPQAGWLVAPSVARVVRRAPTGSPISSRNPEFGTGRTIAMIKPWLPSSP